MNATDTHIESAIACFTVVQSLKPARAGKRYSIGPDGKLAKNSVASITEGQAVTVEATPENLVAVLKKTTESDNRVLCLSSFKGAVPGEPAEISIVVEKKLKRLTGGEIVEPGAGSPGWFDVKGKLYSARLKRLMTGSTWMLFEVNSPPGMPETWRKLTLTERLRLFDKILPGVSKCLRIEYRGSSARVVNGSGEQKPGPTHALIQISDATMLDVLREYVRVETVLKGLSFESPKHSKTEPGKVVGVERLTLFDLAVWVDGRLIFCPKPDVSAAPGYRVLDADIKIVNPNGGVLDVSRIKPPGNDALEEYRDRTGVTLTFGVDDGFRVHVQGQLKLDTEIEHRGVINPLSEWLAWMRANKIDHLRCEAPFRASVSEAAYIKIKGENDVIVHDVGVRTSYHMLPFSSLSDDDVQEAASGNDDALLARRAPKIDPRAFYGPLGKIVTETTKESEATMVGVAAQILAHVSLCLRPFYNPLGDRKIPFNLYVIQVGPSGKGRKGTSAAIADEYLGPALLRLAKLQAARIAFTDEDEIARASAATEVDEAARKLIWTKNACALDECETEIELNALRDERAVCVREIAERKAHLRAKARSPRMVQEYEKLISEAEGKRANIAELITAAEAELAEVRRVLKDQPAALARAKADHDGALAKLRKLPAPAAPPEPWIALFASLEDGPVTAAGVSSGEGLIQLIRDPGQTQGPRGPVHNSGVANKCLFINLDELGSVLAVIMRPGSTLSAILRTMWDCSKTELANKNSPVRCKEPYVTMSASITPSELMGRMFDKRDAASSADNGLGNRLLYLWVKRDKLAAHPRATPGLDTMMDKIARNILHVYKTLKPDRPFLAMPIDFSAQAYARYEPEYHRIANFRAAGPNADKLTERLPVYLSKIAAILAVINGEHEISEEALEAALAWVDYAAGTINAIASTAADRKRTKILSDDGEAILAALKALGGDTKSVSSSEICRKSRLDRKQFDAAVGVLLQLAPSPIAVSEEIFVSGHGTRRSRAMLALSALAAAAGPSEAEEKIEQSAAKIENDADFIEYDEDEDADNGGGYDDEIPY